MEDGGQKGQRDTVPQRHADPQQRQGADLRGECVLRFAKPNNNALC